MHENSFKNYTCNEDLLQINNTHMSNVIGFDYGEKRIGIAVGLLEIGTANPLTTIDIPSSGIPWEQIHTVIQEWKPNKLIVGCVNHKTQNNNSIRSQIRRFCENLKTNYYLPVETIDESYTSIEAYEILKDMRKKRQRRKIKKVDIDKVSAAIILNSWFATNSS